MVLPIYTALIRIDYSLVEAALDLGARPLKTFFTVIVPLTKGGIIRQSLLNLMEATKDSPDVKQELLNRLFSGKRMTGRDEMDICRLLRKNEEEKIRQSELNIIRNFIDEQQLTNSDIPKKSTVPNEDKKGIR